VDRDQLPSTGRFCVRAVHRPHPKALAVMDMFVTVPPMGTTTFPDGPFTLADARQLDITRRSVRNAVADGSVRRVLHNVYVRSELADTVELRAAAAGRVLSVDSVITDRTAAWIHGVDVFVHAEHEVLPPVESCALRWKARARRDGVDGRTRDLQPRDIMTISGVRVTTPLRTALDLGCHLRRRDAFAALCLFSKLYGFTGDVLEREALRYRRRRGVVQLRQLIPRVDPRVDSPREAWTLLAILDADLPVPEPQWWVEDDGVLVFRLDFAYPLHKVAIEYDGRDWHLLTEDQKRHDAERRAWLKSQGWTVIVVRNGDFTSTALDRWLGELRRALASTYSNRRW
jgi:hypothetical protein